MTIEELQRRIDGVISDLQGGIFYDIMVRLSEDAIAMIKRRVVETGVNAEGIPYAQIKDYSPSYKKYKEKKGRYRGFVDFSLTTRMWSSIKLFSSPEQLKKGIAKITATTQFDQEKLDKNTALRGAILELSQDEKAFLRYEYDEMLLNIFRRNGL